MKKTDLGLFPIDWSVSDWSSVLGGFTSGATPSRAIKDYFKGNIRWITSGELNYNTIIDTIEHISKDAVTRTNLTVHPAGTFLMAITGLEAEGTRGSCGIIGKDSTTNQSCLAIYGTPRLMIPYLFYFYVKYGDWLAKHYCQGTKQQSYTASLVKRLPIIYPPSIEEQRCITEVLSDIDSLISSLQKLIEKKKAIKQGAMQELLTGQKRLPGFSGEWSYKSLGILGDLSREVINPQSLSETSFYEYSMPAYDNGRQPGKTSGKSMHSSRLKIYGEIILFNKLNVRQRRVWHVKECLENAVCSSEFLPYHSLGVHSEFLYQVLLCDKTTVDFENMSTGTSNSQKRITPSDFLEYEIALPEKDEQEAIAQVLSDMDSEIEQLEKKLAKYQQIKQGMMQELLTGRIRLKKGENNA